MDPMDSSMGYKQIPDFHRSILVKRTGSRTDPSKPSITVGDTFCFNTFPVRGTECKVPRFLGGRLFRTDKHVLSRNKSAGTQTSPPIVPYIFGKKQSQMKVYKDSLLKNVIIMVVTVSRWGVDPT